MTARVRLLRPKGYSLLDAGNATEGLQQARQHHPDLVIVDIFMPGMSGLELVTHLRAEPDLATIPVLFYTAWYDDYDTRKAMRDDGYAVLAKPVAMSEIVTQIDTILRGRAGQQRP